MFRRVSKSESEFFLVENAKGESQISKLELAKNIPRISMNKRQFLRYFD